MIRKILPILLLLLGVGGGVGAGLALRPAPAADVAADDAPDAPKAEATDHIEPPHDNDPHNANELEYVKLNNQFVVPVVTKKLVEALVVMSLSIEVEAGMTDSVYEREPKLRDGLLQVLFDHANMGGFEGDFTNSNNMDVLRGALTDVAKVILGQGVNGILITDIARQDI